MEPRRTRVLILASSALDRRALTASIPRMDGVELVAVCASLSATRDRLRRDRVSVLAVDASSLDESSAQTLRRAALEKGVYVVEFAPATNPEDTSARVVEAISKAESEPLPVAPPPASLPTPVLPRVAPGAGIHVIAIGSSTGGPDALGELIPRLAADIPSTVLIAQHMPPTFTSILARRLEQRSKLAIHEAKNGEALEAGKVLIAPGDYHLELAEGGAAVTLHQGPPENSCRPAVDVLFRSVARNARGGAIGVVLTGMGKDGCEGARLMRGAGFPIFVQDERTSVVWGMPGLVAREGLANEVAPIPDIARLLQEKLGRSPRSRPRGAEDGTRQP